MLGFRRSILKSPRCAQAMNECDSERIVFQIVFPHPELAQRMVRSEPSAKQIGLAHAH